ncbi:MAG: cobalamin B12-binding domain-containing protein [Candidatus Anammoxibacter sp.]
MNAKILIGKSGLDGHDRGMSVVIKALQVAGFHVVYSGLYLSPDDFVNKALEEKVDAIGISIMTGAYNVILPKILQFMNEKGIGDIPVFAGGIIPEEDVGKLKKMGIKEIFLPGTTLDEIVAFVTGLVKKQK